MNYQTVKDGKIIAIISYTTFIGTIIAFIMNNEKRNAFASFHIKQMIGISLFSFINSFFVLKYLGMWAFVFIGIFLFVCWIIGLYGAINGETRKIPLFADIFQDLFKSIA